MDNIDPAILKLLGGKKRETKRTEAEINEALVLIPKSRRSLLTGQDRINFITRATSGISQHKFGLSYSGNKTELDDVYSLALRVRKFREDCLRHDIHDIFEILPLNENGQLVATEASSSPPSPPSSPPPPSSSSSSSSSSPPRPKTSTSISSSTALSVISSSSSSSSSASQLTKPKNLFDNYKDTSLDMVKKSTRFYYERSTQDYLIENIVWSGEKLLNSCTSELRDMILQKALFLPQKEVGGPVYFKIMMEIYHDASSKARASPSGKKQKNLFDPPSPESSSPSPRSKRMELGGVNPSLTFANLAK